MVRTRLIQILVATLGLAAPVLADIELHLVTGGVAFIVDIQHAGDGTNRLFLVSQAGRIVIWNGTQVLSTPFLDISSRVEFDGEQGLLGLAFHPSYATNGYFYVHYTDTAGDTVLARYSVSSNANVADPMSERVVLTQEQPFTNHKGGQVRFGPDGYLYLALGDGGSGGDPQNHGQRLDSLLGKLLRIDINAGLPYTIPSGNPFVTTPGARDEIWAYGYRNPWRFSFDRATGDMFVADVGQNNWEEINFEPAGMGGRNYGWRLMEGAHCFNPSTNCNNGSLVLPILEYAHSLGCSVTGGFRYRGSAMPAYAGAYFYGDYCTGRIWTARLNGDGTWTSVQRLDTQASISTFGEDAAGELYVAHHGGSGQLYRIASVASGFTDDPLVPGSTSVKAVHITELRARIDALRAGRGLGSFAWTELTLSTGDVVRAVHLSQLRSALSEVYEAAGQPLPAYTDSPLAAGNTIRAAHMSELRGAVLVLE